MHCPGHKKLEGKTIAQVAEMRGKDPFETYFDIMVEEDDETIAIFDYISEDDVKALMVHPLMMISSDGATWSVKGPMTDRRPTCPARSASTRV